MVKRKQLGNCPSGCFKNQTAANAEMSTFFPPNDTNVLLYLYSLYTLQYNTQRFFKMQYFRKY